MSQIININIGKAGVRIGEKFLTNIAKEHFGDNHDIRGKVETFFNETQKKFQSRSIFTDIHHQGTLKLSLNNNCFNIPQKNIFEGFYSDCQTFGIGYSSQVCKLVDDIFQNVRKQVQKCDKMSGFLLINSMGGGSASVITSKVLSKIRQAYCSLIVEQHVILPEINGLCSPTHIYNSVLLFNSIHNEADFCVLSQNSSLSERFFSQRCKKPTFDQINQIHAQSITEVTSSYRFGGSLNTNQRKICINTVMFPRMKYLISSFSCKSSPQSYLEEAFNKRNYSISDIFDDGTGQSDIFTMHVNCRDHFAYESEIDAKVRQWVQNSNLNVAYWIPNSIHMSITESLNNIPSANILINTKHVAKTFRKIAKVHQTMFRRRAFVFHYLRNLMDEMQFVEAESNLQDLISQYDFSNNEEAGQQE